MPANQTPPNPLPCGCKVQAAKRRAGLYVEHCALHEAAPALLKALEDIGNLDVRFASAGYARANKAVSIARIAIAKACPEKVNPMDKTIDNVTRRELAELAGAAGDLLGAARMMYWQGRFDDDENDDHSFADAIGRMVRALIAIGLPQISTAEFIEDLEAMLESGMSPEEWRIAHADAAVAKARPESEVGGVPSCDNCGGAWFPGHEC